MTNAISAHGTLLQIGDGATTEAFTTIAEVRDIKGPAMEMETKDVTSHDSSGWDEHIGILMKGGEVTFDIGFIPTNATHSQGAGLIADMIAKTLRNFQLVFPDTGTTTWAFSALVKSFESAQGVKDDLMASVTLLISGQPTLA
jgi:hypothetical protein